MSDNEKLDLLLDKVSGIENKVSGIENKVSDIENKVSGIENKVSDIENKVSGIENKVSGIENKVSGIENKVSGIELTLENEIRTNIKRVAEGHIDLSRNLHDALKIDNEKEMLSIRVSILETELRKIKEQLDQIA